MSLSIGIVGLPNVGKSTLFNALTKKGVPIYIGDDMTDEDAFGALLRGITIRVGKRRGSAAHLFVRTREDVDTILSLLADN